MPASDMPRTVDEAELAGGDGLAVSCNACRATYIVHWHLIRRRSGYRKLKEIKQRLVCRKCRITPARVALHRVSYPVEGGSPQSEELAI